MNREPSYTLSNVRKSDKLKEDNITQASDFLTPEQKQRIETARRLNHLKKRRFDEVDAYCAEMISRFGYDFYKDWKAGAIEDSKVIRMILAERARDKQNLLSLEAIIIAMISPTIQRQKGKPAPKSPKVALSIFKEDSKVARGE